MALVGSSAAVLAGWEAELALLGKAAQGGAGPSRLQGAASRQGAACMAPGRASLVHRGSRPLQREVACSSSRRRGATLLQRRRQGGELGEVGRRGEGCVCSVVEESKRDAPTSATSPRTAPKELDLEDKDRDGRAHHDSHETSRLIERKGDDEKRLEVFGVPVTPDTTAIATVYFVQGVIGLARLAVSFFMKDELHLDPTETALLSGVSAGPWLIKPLYGFISDGLPLFGYRRRSYLVLSGLLGAASWGSLALFVNSTYSALACIFFSSLAVAVSDVVVDSMVVERARGESQATSGSLQSLCWGSSAVGGIVSAYFSGSLVEQYGTRFVFGVTALLPLATSCAALLVQEKRLSQSPALEIAHKSSDPQHKAQDSLGAATAGGGGEGTAAEQAAEGFVETARVQLQYLWTTIKEPSIFFPTLFIFLWHATPQSDTAMFFFTTNQLHFGPEFLGRVRLVTSVASLIGVGVYNTYLKEVPLRRMFLWTTVIGTALGCTQLLLVTGANRSLGISDQFFAVGDNLILTVLGQVSFMPVLVLAARLCPPGVEATLFAALMSITNGAGVTGGLLGAGLTKLLGVSSTSFDNLALLLVLCNFSSLLPLAFLGLLPSSEEMESAVASAQEKIDARKEV